MKQHYFKTLVSIIFTLISANVLGVEKEGYYKGMHWVITEDPYAQHPYANGLTVDGKLVIPEQYLCLFKKDIGDEIYFHGTGYEKHDEEIFNINGERIIPYKFRWLEKLQVGNGNFFIARRYSLDSPGDLFTSKGKLITSNYQEEVLNNYIKRITDSKYGEMFLVKAKDDNNRIKQGLFTTSGDCIIPIKYKTLNWTTDDNNNVVTFEVTNDNDYIGIMDRDKNWIVPLSKQFTKVTPSEISGKKYFVCMKKGYWGLYDAQFNEIIAPDYEELEVLDETNFIKFRLNGFWGVMTLQANTNTTKTIIPTTRGYTSIGRYIKSQKRFTYTMNGYKGECNHLGQQVSKIKVASPKPSTSVASSLSSSSSSSRTSSSSSSSSKGASSSSSSSDDNKRITYDYYKNASGKKIKGKYEFTIQFKSDAVYFKLTNKKKGSTIYNFKLKELNYSITTDNLIIGFKGGNSSHVFIFKKGYYDPVEHLETNMTTNKETITSYLQDSEDVAAVLGATLLVGTTPAEIFFDWLFENLSFYQGGCKIHLIENQ